MNSILFVDHDVKRFTTLRYLQGGEFEFDLTFSGWICLCVNQTFKPDLVLFDLKSDLMSEADARQLLCI